MAGENPNPLNDSIVRPKVGRCCFLLWNTGDCCSCSTTTTTARLSILLQSCMTHYFRVAIIAIVKVKVIGVGIGITATSTSDQRTATGLTIIAQSTH